jgi:phage tail-like protein
MKTRPRQRQVLPAVVVAVTAALAAGLGQASAAPVASAHFEIHVNGVNRATFTSLVATSSPKLSSALVVTDAAGEPHGKKAAGPPSPPSITLERPLTKSPSNRYLFNWRTAARKGATSAFKDCRFVIYDAAGSVVLRYRLVRARPTKIEIPAMKVGQETTMQRVTFVADELVPETT